MRARTRASEPSEYGPLLIADLFGLSRLEREIGESSSPRFVLLAQALDGGERTRTSKGFPRGKAANGRRPREAAWLLANLGATPGPPRNGATGPFRGRWLFGRHDRAARR
jgi:hypothetical protein